MIHKRIVKTFFSAKPRQPGALFNLCIILFCTAASVWAWQEPINLQWSVGTYPGVYERLELWRAVTAVFVHADGLHLISNMYMLFILGYFIHGYFGFYAHPFLSLVGASLTNVLALFTYSPEVRLLGASGWVYYLAGFWLTLFFLIERQRTIPARILRVLGVGLVILFPSSFEMQVSYRTHAIGLFVGTLFGWGYFLVNKQSLRQFEQYKEEDGDEDGLQV